MKTMHTSRIRSRFIMMFVGLAVAPLLIAGMILGVQSYNEHLSIAQEHQQIIAERVSVEASEFFHRMRDILSHTVNHAGLMQMDRSRQMELLSTIVNRTHLFSNIALLDANGSTMVQVSKDHFITPGEVIVFAESNEFNKSKEHLEFISGPVFFNTETGEPLITISQPIIDLRNNSFQGAIVATGLIKEIWNLIAEINHNKSGDIFILDSKHRVIAHKNPTIVLRGTTFHSSHANKRQKNFHNKVQPGLSGKSVIIGGQGFQFGQEYFYVVAESLESFAMAPAIRAALQISLIVVITIFGASILTIYSTRKILNPIQSISDSIKIMHRGNLKHRIKVDNDDEIGLLANAINKMAAHLEENIGSLQQQKDQIRLILDSTDEAIYGINLDGKCIFANLACIRMLGYDSYSDLLGQDMHKLIHHSHEDGSSYPTDECHIHQTFKQGQSVRVSNEVMWRKDGKSFPVEYSSTPIIHNNNVDGTVVVFIDITRRKEADRAIKNSEETLRQLAENINEVVWLVSPDWQSLFYVSPAYEEIWGKPCNSLYQAPLSWLESVHPDDKDAVHNYLERKAGGELDDILFPEYRVIRPDGSVRWIRAHGKAVTNEKGEVYRIAGIAADITAQKDLIQELRKKEARYRSVIETSSDGFLAIDNSGHITEANDAYVQCSGYTRNELLGMHISELDGIEDASTAAKHIQRAITRGYELFESQHKTKDGKLWHVEINVTHSTIGEGQFFSFIRDISDRKKALQEQERVQRELQQAHKMESLGQLTGGVAHDFNNLLGVIMGFSGLALDKCVKHEDDKLVGYLQNIRTAGERAAQLISQMLAFSRIDKTEDKPIHFQPLIKEDIKMLRSTLPTSIEIKTEIEENLPTVMMNPTQLHQILMNMSINARDAMHGQGTLTIRLGLARNLDGECAACHRSVQGDWVELAISDTGSGIEPETLKHIFDPFFTTKEVGKGTGMGLAVVYGIMRKHQGHILVDTETGKGSTFRLLFSPVIEEHAGISENIQQEAAIPQGNGAHILIVDDEVVLAEFLGELVQSFDYHSTVMTDSKEALALFTMNPEEFDLVITDQTMPGLTGVELVEKFRELRPELPVILCTGFSETIDAKKAEKMGIHYHDKPVQGKELIQTIGELIGYNEQ